MTFVDVLTLVLITVFGAFAAHVLALVLTLCVVGIIAFAMAPFGRGTKKSKRKGAPGDGRGRG